MIAMRLTLQKKIVLLSGVVAFFSAFFVGGFAFHNISRNATKAAILSLAGETRVISEQIRAAYRQMQNDASIVLYTPPIEGMIRAEHNGGVDPKDGSTRALWKERLETIFLSIMRSRPYYTQMRYIGLADNGRELVRVNRTEKGLQAVSLSGLREKGDEFYFKRGKLLKKGGVYFSEVSDSPEQDQVSSIKNRTVRSVVPVYYEDQLFGMIVVNASYEQLLANTFLEIQPTKDMFAINHGGDYVEYNAEKKHVGFEPSDGYTHTPPEFVKEIMTARRDEHAFTEGDEISYFVRLNIDPNNPDAFLGVVLRAPKAVLLKDAYEAQRLEMLLGGSIVLVCLFGALVAARRFTQPLRQMTAVVAQMDKTKLDFAKLPVNQKDEIGDFAQSFANMAQKLQSSEDKSRAVLDHVVDGIISIDNAGSIETFNPACERIFGYQLEEVRGKNVKMLMPAPYRHEHDQYLKNYLETGVKKIIGIGREVEGKRKDGSVFPLELSISEVDVQGKHLFTGIVRDITERKQMEKMKDEFISTVNHELRTPLTSIQTALGLLKMDADELEEDGKRMLDLAYTNCERLTALVNDILDIEKIAAGKMVYVIESVEVNALVKEVIEQHKGYAEKYGVQFKFMPALENLRCRLDKNRFTQALANLLSNAAKFSLAGDMVLVSVTQLDESRFRISVADSGEGIPASFHDKIFSKFAQADASSTRSKGGTGLGLNITKSIIEAFGGRVDFESEENKGSIFYFTLPVDYETIRKKEVV